MDQISSRELRNLLGAVGDRDARAAGCATGGVLTQREAEVLHWVAAGKSNDDVARIIGVASATVKKHLEHIYDKLAVANRTAASALYLRFKRDLCGEPRSAREGGVP